MKLEIQRDGLWISLESDQDRAYAHDTLGLPEMGSGLDNEGRLRVEVKALQATAKPGGFG